MKKLFLIMALLIFILVLPCMAANLSPPGYDQPCESVLDVPVRLNSQPILEQEFEATILVVREFFQGLDNLTAIQRENDQNLILAIVHVGVEVIDKTLMTSNDLVNNNQSNHYDQWNARDYCYLEFG